MALLGKDIQLAKKYLQQGKLVAIPTETVYGLAANAFDGSAVASIFAAKQRPSFDPLIVHIATIDRLGELTHSIPPMALDLAGKFWPGPLTLVLPKKNVIPDLVSAGLPTVGVRCPDHPLTGELLLSLDFPLAAPSANPFGYVSPTTPQHVEDQLGDQVAYILDGGPCEIGLESTIVGFESERPVLLRRGGLTQEDIEAVVGPMQVRTQSSSNPSAPGQLESHYAPRHPLWLGDIEVGLRKHAHLKLGVLAFQRKYAENQITLSPEGQLSEAAQNLFSSLRELDKKEIDLIIAERVPDMGLGKAINDRLTRAAAQRSA